MGSLHEALQCLGPTTWDEVPKEQPELRDYLRDIAGKARLIVDSVPEQEPQQQQQQHQHQPQESAGEECDATQHSHDTSHTSGKPYKITTSPARASTNNNTGTTDPDLQRQWGKPIKAGNSRDNPYGIPMYKMQAADGKAAWFARRSVHEGMPYSRWKEKLSDEIEWTLRMNKARLEKGQAPDRVVRGLGAVKKVEEVSVFGDDDDGDGDGGGDGKEVLGGVKVFDICAHFPKPTTPRDFVQLCASWGEDMGEDSSGEEKQKGQGQRRCRNWLFVSKPCVHPDLTSYDGYLRGQYESVEFIREVLPARDDKVQGSGKSAKSVTWSDTNLVQHEDQESQKDKTSPPRVSTESTTPEKLDEKPDGSVDDDETNPYPVEWIMITRSDPGGSIPRWIIEKGTPKSIWGDTVKFLDWARHDQDEDQETTPRESAEDSSKPATPAQQPPVSEDNHAHAESDLYDDSVNASEKENENDTYPEGEQRTGLIANFAYLVNAGLERYAPKAVLDYVPYQHAYGSTQRISTYNTDDDDDDDDDTASFVSTESNPNNINNDQKNDANASSASVVSDALSRHNVPPIDTMEKEKKEKLSSHEKQLAKLAQRKRDVQDKLDAVRAEIEELRIDAGTDDTTRDEKREKPDETKESKDEAKEVKETREEKNKRKEEEKAKKEEEKARRGKEKEDEKVRKEKEKEEEKARKEKEKEEKRKEREKEKEEKRREKELEKEKKKNDKRKSKEPTPEAEPEAEPKSDAESSSDEKQPKETTTSEKAAQSNTNLSLRSKTPSKSQDDLSQQEDDSDGRSTTTTTTTTTTKKRQSTSTPTNPNIPQIHKAASNLFAQESKLLKQLGKIERDQIKTASKIDARQQKQHEREEKIRSRLERDQLRSEIDGVKKEVERLRGERQQWMDLVAQVQEENAKLKKQQNEVGLGQGQE